jgi:Flp pilus assembly protein TadG
MKQFAIQGSGGRGESGQMLPLIALSLVALIGLVGLGIDLGFAYVTKARLSKAVDAAALAGMENINQGTAIAQSIATATFYANYAGGTNRTSLDLAPVTPTYTFTPSTAAATQITVYATTNIRTFFSPVLGVIGGKNWTQLTVGDNASVSRVPLYVTLVLDRSQSLDVGYGGNSGRLYMYTSVTNFFGFFSDSIDHAGLITFATTSRVDVAMSQPFITTIDTKVQTIYANDFSTDYTFAQGGMTNGLVQQNQVSVPSNATRAVVFFTDGEPNQIRDTLPCNTHNTDVQLETADGQGDVCYLNPTNGCPLVYPASNPPNCFLSGCGSCPGVTKFRSGYNDDTTPNTAINEDNVIDDSRYRTIVVADDMRKNSIYVYAIGLGTVISGNALNTEFLREVANDPDQDGSIRAHGGGSYKATTYDGAFVLAADPTGMRAAFQRVAEQIAVKLTR